jgi:hypothetical protein
MANRRDDGWDTLRECLPGLRKPALGSGLDRERVGALLRMIEAEVSRQVGSAFEWADDDTGRLVAAGRSYRAGRFTTPSIGELETSVRLQGKSGEVALFVLLGDHPLTDIGALQAMAGPRTMFQVASQFNCLEAPGPTLARIADYVNDNTQGPRASVSAFPGTFLRHYAAPSRDGTRFTQSGVKQINLLADAVEPVVAQVRNGYLTADQVADPVVFERTIEAGFEKIRVGVHDDVQVVFGRNWGGPVEADAPTIAQVFTSTMALGAYSRGATDTFAGSCSWLLRAAYLGTLLAALDLRKHAVVLTLIGGGAFGNSPRSIWDAIVWAADRANACAPSDLIVVVNARGMNPGIPSGDLAEMVRARRGAVVTVG